MSWNDARKFPPPLEREFLAQLVFDEYYGSEFAVLKCQEYTSEGRKYIDYRLSFNDQKVNPKKIKRWMEIPSLPVQHFDEDMEEFKKLAEEAKEYFKTT